MLKPLPIDAAACYQTGCALYNRHHFLDAQRHFDRACTLSPDNTDYREARERLYRMAALFFKKPGGNGALKDCSGKCCEACGEGGCECCCEALADGGCDCDCS